MYKISFVLFFLVVLSTALPVDIEVKDTEYEAAPRADRHTRATCDLLSASVKGVTLNHSACAAHCLLIGNGYRGGRCINGVCHCRK